VFSIGALLALAMCAESTNVRVEEADGFVPPDRAHVSVFGVFHDGRMSEPAWLALAPKVSAALDSPRCELGYGQQLRNAQPELAREVERSIRENGIDDAVLAKVAPYATGDFVMVLMSYRQLPTIRHHDGGGATARPAQPMARSGGGRFRGSSGTSHDYSPEEEEHVYEIAASLYSIREHKLVAQIDLRHSGDDFDAALDAFALKLDALLPHARCVGWNFPEAADTATDAGSDDAPPSNDD
jgi:hypothetical protein